MKKALIAMSGGVDSSVAAYLTLQAGYSCVGCTMKLFARPGTDPEQERRCDSTRDIDDARAIADSLHFPYHVVHLEDDFVSRVVEPFVRAYENGETPNPCITCNRYLKFGRLLSEAQACGCDTIVTGHYARVERKGDTYLLKKALDPTKDQSYVLFNLTQDQLAHIRFPLGELTKAQARRIAEEHGFANAQKKDSQDICFIPDGDYAAFLKRYTGREYPPGDFLSASGEVLGRHKGIIHYTIGQHKGLGLVTPEPLYVGAIHPADNTITLVRNEDLFRRTVFVDSFNWVGGAPPQGEIPCLAKIRYRQKEKPSVATPLPGGMVRIEFEEPERAVTPGQAAVLYDGDTVLGGGRIVPSPEA
ncbi:MAG: tRNA 2-thiouridine(34) synthase MnmA [Clostridia bacterium]|nr:tRNA 2-thiouridine(34) synthase MnmA [Clostridia bacterium]